MQLRFLTLLKSRRAVSAVISNMILIAAVIAVGFAALAWTYSNSNSYTRQYGGSVLSNTNQLEERIAFEYIFYDKTTTSLLVYVINYGNIGTVSLTTGHVSNSSWISSNFFISLHFFNDSITDPVRVLGIGQEGWFKATTTSLQSGSYTVNIVTGRGSSFAGTFAA